MQPARRYEAERTVAVVICWECGAETPALYRRTAIGRNTSAPLLDPVPCPRCRTPFVSVAWLSGRRAYCSQLCANRNNVERLQRSHARRAS